RAGAHAQADLIAAEPRHGRRAPGARSRTRAPVGITPVGSHPGITPPPSPPRGHSHSIVPGGFDVTSSTTRLTSRTSLVIRVEILARTSYGSRDQSAVMASSLETGRSTIG